MRTSHTIGLSILSDPARYDDKLLMTAASAENWEIVYDGLANRHVTRDLLHTLVQIACFQQRLPEVKYLFCYEQTLTPHILLTNPQLNIPAAQIKVAFEKIFLKLNLTEDSEFLQSKLLSFFKRDDLALDFILRLLTKCLSAPLYDKRLVFFLLKFVNFAQSNKFEIALHQKLDVLDSSGSWGEAKIIALNKKDIEVSFTDLPEFYNEKVSRSMIPNRCAPRATLSRFQPFFQIIFEKNYIDVAIELVKHCNMPAELLIIFNKLYAETGWSFVCEYLAKLGKSCFTATFLNDLIARALVTDDKNSALEFLLEFAGNASDKHVAIAMRSRMTWQLLLLFRKFPQLSTDNALAHLSHRAINAEVASEIILNMLDDANFSRLVERFCQFRSDAAIVLTHSWIHVIELLNVAKGVKLLSIDVKLACDIFCFCIESGGKFSFFKKVLRNSEDIIIPLPLLQKLLCCLISKDPVNGGIFIAEKYQADFLKNISLQYQCLVSELIKYCVIRQVEKREYSLFSIWGRYKGFSAKLKIASALKIVAMLAGGEVQFNSKELECLNDGRLVQIFKDNQAVDLITAPAIYYRDSLRRFF